MFTYEDTVLAVIFSSRDGTEWTLRMGETSSARYEADGEVLTSSRLVIKSGRGRGSEDSLIKKIEDMLHMGLFSKSGSVTIEVIEANPGEMMFDIRRHLRQTDLRLDARFEFESVGATDFRPVWEANEVVYGGTVTHQIIFDWTTSIDRYGIEEYPELRYRRIDARGMVHEEELNHPLAIFDLVPKIERFHEDGIRRDDLLDLEWKIKWIEFPPKEVKVYP